MNKIYKVVWSKVKHCYVVTSELAKRQTKGCGARSLRMATVSLGVAASLLCAGAVLPIFGESVAEAGVVKVGNKYYSGIYLKWNGETKTVTASEGTTDDSEKVYAYGNISRLDGTIYRSAILDLDSNAYVIDNVDGTETLCYDDPIKIITLYPTAMDGYEANKDVSGYSITVNMTSNQKFVDVYGGYSKEGNVSGNSATITNGSITDSVYGGYTNGGKVSNNTVNLNGGTVHKVYGGYTTGGAAETNHVVMNGGVVGITTTGGKTVLSGGQLYGAYSYNSSGNSGNVTGNTVTVEKGTVLATVYGGNTQAEGSGNQSGDATENIVTIKDGTLAGDMYGGYSSSLRSTSGKVEGNIINITGGVLDKVRNIQVNGISLQETAGVGRIYGGYTHGNDASGIAKDNVVTISGGTLRSDTEVTGGYSNANNAEHNIVKIESTYTGTAGNVIGGEAGGNGTAKKNEVTISGGTVRDSNDSGVHVFGGKASTGSAIENKVTINKNATVNSHVDGGYTTAGTAENNEVTIDGGNVNGVVNGGSISYEGDTTPGAVTGNTVTIKNGSKVGFQNASGIYGGYVAGGRSYGDLANAGDVTGNKVFIMGGEVYDVYGGLSELGRVTLGSKTYNSGDVTKNEVEISGGTVGGKVYGGWTNNGTAGGSTDAGNKVTVSGGIVKGIVYGGYTDSGDAKFNSVAVSGSGQVNNTVYGGCSENGGKAIGNTVTLGDSAKITGGITGGWSPKSDAENNTVTVNNGTVSGYINGGVATGTAKENHIIVNNGTVSYLQGGSGASAIGNTIEVNNGTVSGYIYGGSANNGTAGGDTANDGNKVTISGGTVEGTVYGGYTNSGDAKYNSVSISGSGQVNNTVYGGYSYSGAATDNTVSIEGGTVNANVWGGQGASSSGNKITMSGGIFSGLLMIGGIGTSGSGDGNTVTISGGTFSGSNYNSTVQGGAGKPGSLNNTVNLTSTVTGLENVGLFGGGDSDNYSGNELHVGGTKDGTVTGVWQGKTGDTVNNKVKTVARFDKVVLHSVKWDKDVAALEATSVNNVKTLDITNLKFYTDAEGTTQKTSFTEGESMALLKSAESKLSSVKLDYADVTGATITTTGIILGGGATDKTEETGVNGVKLTQSVTEKVKLTEDEYAINYSCEVGEVKKVTFNASTPITFADKGIARDLASSTFASSNTVDADGLTFADSSEAIANGAFMTLLANATGITTKVDNETGKTIAIKDYEDAQKIKYSATATGTVSSADGAVKYTVSSVTLNSIDLAGWTGDASNLADGNTSGWTGAGVAVKGSFTEPEVAANSSRDILTSDVTGMFTDGAIDDAIKYKAGVTFEGDEAKGVTLTGTQSKGVKADDNGKKLVYEVGTKDVTGITLGNMKVGDPRDMNTDYNFAGVTTLDASALTFDKPENVSANMNLVTNAAGIPTEMYATAGKDHTQSFEQTAGNNVKLTANLKGTVATDTSVVKYTYGGKELTKVDLKDWNGNEATFDATGWTKGASAAIETAGLSVTVDPGVEKTVLTVSGDGVDLTGITVNGEAYQWKNGGDSIAETSAENGVKITAGETTGGGIKGDGNKIIYKGSSKKVTGLEVTNVDFVKDGVAREFKNDYDLTNAAITVASGITISNTAAMNAGDTMVVVDATDAIKVVGEATRTLKDFTTDPAPITVAFKDEKVDGKELTFEGTHKDTLSLNDDKNKVLYTVGDKNVNKATFTGEVAWNDSEAYYTNDASKYIFDTATAVDVDATNLKVTGTTDKALKRYDVMTLLSAQDMTAGTVTPQSEANKTASRITINYNDTASGIVFGAEATGAVKTEANAVKYEVEEITLKTVDLAGWNGNTAGVTDGWSAQPKSVAVNNADAITIVPATTKDIITAGSSMFADVNVEKTVDFDPVTQNGVTLTGTQKNVIKTNANNDTITYEVGKKDVKTVDIGTVEWGGEALDGSGTEYNYAGASVDHSGFEISNPEQVETNTAMTLLKANETLAAMAEETKKTSYAYSPVSGVRIDGDITGTMSRSGNDVVFTATENKASKLTFTNVEWKDSGALMTRPANITFAGADVDTAKINFHNIQELAANSKMTLVSDFGETVGTITGDTFTVGSGLKGEGAASLSGTDLIFTAKTAAESLTPTEATHETVMAMEAGTAVVAAGREYVDSAVEGLGLVSNMAPDGTSTFASMGGGVGRYKTGSHVDTHTWSAVVAVGSKREHKKGNLEWGVFAEYGRGNYTLHDDNGGRGDGNTNYAGGGLLAKWTNKHDVYTEASVRMGRMSDSASNMLRDVLGNMYGYDVHANYFGAHVGLGKIIKVKKNRDLDVYGKYFYLRRNGVDFDAGGNHYTLDSVASSLLRIGARYGSNDKKWNWYGGLAYEYEFDGQSKGNVDGLAIRSASIKGGSVRGELGMRMEATKTNPWKVDIGIYGYGGKHRGFGGNVSVAYMF